MINNKIIIGVLFFTVAIQTAEDSRRIHNQEMGKLEEEVREDREALKKLRTPLEKLMEVHEMLFKSERNLEACKRDLEIRSKELEGINPTTTEQHAYCEYIRSEHDHLETEIKRLNRKIPHLQKQAQTLKKDIPWDDIEFLENHLQGVEAILGLDSSVENHIERNRSLSNPLFNSHRLRHNAVSESPLPGRIFMPDIQISASFDSNGEPIRRIVRRRTGFLQTNEPITS